jgi:hypothetical protein
VTHLFEGFAPRFEFLVDLDSGLRHALMRFFRATHQGEVVAPGHAFVAVGIEADA